MAVDVFVVTEAYGASAVAKVFGTFEAALFFASARFDNYTDCESTSHEVDYGARLASFSATWSPRVEGVISSVHINVWSCAVQK